MNIHQYHNESDASSLFSDESEDDNAAQPPQIFFENRPCTSSIIITRKAASVNPLNSSVDQLNEQRPSSPVHEQTNEYFRNALKLMKSQIDELNRRGAPKDMPSYQFNGLELH